jgi:hypothetical protein
MKWEYIKRLWIPPYQSLGGYAPSTDALWKDENSGRYWKGHELMEALTDLGQEGWELASMAVYPSGGEFAILKRVIPDG